MNSELNRGESPEVETNKSTAETMVAASNPPILQPGPIIIKGGSLSIECIGVHWSEWTTVTSSIIKHPLDLRKVTRIEVFNTSEPTSGAIFTFDPTDGKCSVKVTYTPPI